MKIQEISELSESVLTRYYDNDIKPFLDACHRDVMWIGPAENQIIRTREALVAAFGAEQHQLKFVLNNLTVVPLAMGSSTVFEIVMMFLVDTIWPDSSMNRVKQRIHLTWVVENGVPYIRLCHISNAIRYDERDNIYPVHYEDSYSEMVLAGMERSKRVIINSPDKSLVYLNWSWVMYAETKGTHAVVHTIDGSFESVQSLRLIEKRYSDLFVRCHESYLVNPDYVARISRLRIELTNGKILPVPEKKYTAVKAILTERERGRIQNLRKE